MPDIADAPQSLGPVCKLWIDKIRISKDHREEVFDKFGDLAHKYYTQTHNFIYSKRGSDSETGFAYSDPQNAYPTPTFKVTFNKVAELVQLFGPRLYHDNPIRTVTPRRAWTPPESLQLIAAAQTVQTMQMQNAPDLVAAMAQRIKPIDMALQQQTQDRQRENDINKARAELLSMYLNFTPNELNLKEESRLTIDEGLVRGQGVWWTEIYQPEGSRIKYIGSFHDSVKNLFIDPDVLRLEDAKWIARLRRRPAWEMERLFNLPEGYIKSVAESTQQRAENNGDDKRRERTADLCEYYEVYSKMGIGARLKALKDSEHLKDAVKILEAFGDNIYLVLHESCPYPLNIPAEYIDVLLALGEEDMKIVMNPPPIEPPPVDPFTGQPMVDPATGKPMRPIDPIQSLRPIVGMVDDVRRRLAWPLPFHADGDWPVTPLPFHPQYDCLWPMSHLKPALGEQDFLDWAYSFIAGHVRNTCRDFLVVSKQAEEELKDIIQHGPDMSFIALNVSNRSISELVQFLQHPQMNEDLFKALQYIERNFEKRTGMTEYMYGETASQSRSGTDAELKGQMMQIRPDDMAKRLEHAMTKLARKEGIAARLILRGPDVISVVGEQGALWWDQTVATDDVTAACREFDYRIEAGSARKPNRERESANMAEAIQFLGPILKEIAMATGNWKPFNTLLKDWAKSKDLDTTDYLLEQTPMPPPPGMAAAPPNGQPDQPAQAARRS